MWNKRAGCLGTFASRRIQHPDRRVELPVRAEMRRYRVTPNARSPAHSGCCLCDPHRSAIRPSETFPAGAPMTALAPSLPFRTRPMYGREAQETGLWLKAKDAPGAAVL
jgi:hypothetical protein